MIEVKQNKRFYPVLALCVAALAVLLCTAALIGPMLFEGSTPAPSAAADGETVLIMRSLPDGQADGVYGLEEQSFYAENESGGVTE